MTCREKFEREYPNIPFNYDQICQDDYCYVSMNHDKCHTMTCKACWEQEVPEKQYEHEEPAAPIAPTIKDSGDRTQFESGAVRDMHEGKGRMDLLPWAAIMEVSKHCENGAKKYGEHNVDRGIPTSSLCDSAARHLAKYLEGWVDEPHLVSAAWNLLWAIQMEIKHPEVVNTPWKEEATNE